MPAEIVYNEEFDRRELWIDGKLVQWTAEDVYRQTHSILEIKRRRLESFCDKEEID